jgi:hypothetical protein
VWRKNRGKQIIRNVEISNETGWRNKHLRSIREQYAHAPYIKDVFSVLEEIYNQEQNQLLNFNLKLLQFLWKAFSIRTQMTLQTEVGVSGVGTDLLINLCRAVGADTYRTLPPVEKYLDAGKFQANGIKLEFIRFTPPVYPQLWGDFRYNLSALDLLLTCGPRSTDILMYSCEVKN